MAHQLHYTSAATGLAGRPGFQFVATSPGTTMEAQQAVVPYLNYQPPPSAPTAPTPDQLAQFPVAYTFARDGDTALLVHCRYLGTDYSGRYGNFLGHAVLVTGAERADRGDLRPIDLWGSPIWATAPATGPAGLPALTDLPRGPVADPDLVAAWLAAGGDRYRRLAELVEAARAALAGDTGQVVLVADTDRTIARWLTAISYSLPPAAAWELTFATYAADPARARTHLVGTTADAWSGDERGLGPVFRLDQPATAPGAPGGPARRRYATVVVDAWRSRDLADLDLLHQVVGPVGAAGQDTGAALVALFRGTTVPPSEQDAVAGLLRRYGDRLTDRVWDRAWGSLDRDDLTPELAFAVAEAARRAGRGGLADRATTAAVVRAIGRADLRERLREVRLPPTGQERVATAVDAALRAAPDLADLTALLTCAHRLGAPVSAAAVRAGAAAAVRAGAGTVRAAQTAASELGGGFAAALLDGAVDGLADADPALIAARLPGDVCDLMVDLPWDRAPRVGAHVLASFGQRHPKQRVAITDALVDLAERRLLPDDQVEERVREVWRAPEPSVADCLALFGGDGLLSPHRAQRRCLLELAGRALAAGDLTSADTYTLAYRLGQLHPDRPDEPVLRQARAVIATHHLDGDDPQTYAALNSLLAATPAARAAAIRHAARDFGRANPTQQARILLALGRDGPLRPALVGALTHRPPRRDDPRRADFAEVAIRLWFNGRPEKTLTNWTVRWATHPAEGPELRRALAGRHEELPRQLARMCEERRRPARAGRLGRLFRRG